MLSHSSSVANTGCSSLHFTECAHVHARASSTRLCADPAVSLMLLLRGKISSGKALAYMVAQVAGAVLGAFICTVIIPGVEVGAGLGAPGACWVFDGVNRLQFSCLASC